MMPNQKDSKHAKMVKDYKKTLKEIDEESEERENDIGTEWFLEYPYNYYGSRGYIDLLEVHYTLPREISIYEMKTSIEDVGEIVRQFKRMRKYFPKYLQESIKNNDELEDIQVSSFANFEIQESKLVILWSEENYEVIEENIDYFHDIPIDFIKIDQGIRDWKNKGEDKFFREKTPSDNQNNKMKKETSKMKIESELTYDEIVDIWEREKDETELVNIDSGFYSKYKEYHSGLKSALKNIDEDNPKTRKEKRIKKQFQRVEKIFYHFLMERSKKIYLMAYHAYLGEKVDESNLLNKEEKFFLDLKENGKNFVSDMPPLNELKDWEGDL